MENKLIKAQEAWDNATNAYSRYKGLKEWEVFLECKEQVLRLRRLLTKPVSSAEVSTSQKIYVLLQSSIGFSSSDICNALEITKDQLRHGLLKLLDEGKIEKIKMGFYRALLQSSS